MRRISSLDDAVTRVMCHLLRHDPGAYGVVVDDQGWAEISSVLSGVAGRLRALCVWRKPTREDLMRICRGSSPQRFQIVGERIRATYGHSLGSVEAGVVREPPEHLFHGTCGKLLPMIRNLGLIPAARRFVHLTSNVEYAGRVAVHKSPMPVLLRIRSDAAAVGGVVFRQANAEVWLATPISSEFIEGQHLMRAFNVRHSADFTPVALHCLRKTRPILGPRESV